MREERRLRDTDRHHARRAAVEPGSDVQTAQDEQANLKTTLTAVSDQRQSVSSVSLDEEMTNLIAFQNAHGIPPSGKADPATWAALLALPPVTVDWTGGGPSG